MNDLTTMACGLSNRIDKIAAWNEDQHKIDMDAGELSTPNNFSRGYLLGYLHGLQSVYDALPDWAQDEAAFKGDGTP